jgi:hypothetical protein
VDYLADLRQSDVARNADEEFESLCEQALVGGEECLDEAGCADNECGALIARSASPLSSSAIAWDSSILDVTVTLENVFARFLIECDHSEVSQNVRICYTLNKGDMKLVSVRTDQSELAKPIRWETPFGSTPARESHVSRIVGCHSLKTTGVVASNLASQRSCERNLRRWN